MIKISICYATPKKQVEIPLEVEENCTVAIAIKRSGILKQFPEINLAQVCVGIYSKRTTLDGNVGDGDRIEIYRSLLIDPKQARLLRAQRLSSKIARAK
ncbi:RnfH family protein [Candidatus Coxiella mudrowiae]|uniref:RnfH family protein n=1 Tax=Candidatus Coxiella mudrowiae TaxID=2054173 RepID=UPI000C293331|nr:RnfH family protein [Candidatus Coxiella mudrowiae]